MAKFLSRVQITEGAIADIHFSQERPRTEIGPQGDHSSAYALFKLCIIKKCVGLSTEAAHKVLLGMIDSYLCDKEYKLSQDDSQEMFEEFHRNVSVNNKRREEERNVVFKIKPQDEICERILQSIDTAYYYSMSQHFDTLVDKHLRLRNKLFLTSFPREGNIPAPKDEGSVIKTAISNLDGLNELNAGNVDKVVKNINDLLHYPKITPTKRLIDFKGDEEARKDWNRENGYNLDTRTRSNDPALLGEVLANHMHLVVSCFPVLGNDPAAFNALEKKFLESHIKAWKLSAEDKKKMLEFYNRRWPIEHVDLKESDLSEVGAKTSPDDPLSESTVAAMQDSQVPDHSFHASDIATSSGFLMLIVHPVLAIENFDLHLLVV